jgi:hypothetical protein
MFGGAWGVGGWQAEGDEGGRYSRCASVGYLRFQMAIRARACEVSE